MLEYHDDDDDVDTNMYETGNDEDCDWVWNFMNF